MLLEAFGWRFLLRNLRFPFNLILPEVFKVRNSYFLLI